MRILGIIPARFASSRLPGKPLADIEGKSMIMRVYEQARQAELLTDVIIATDDERILTHATENNATAVLTSEDHPTGTDRCMEALTVYCNKFENNFDAVINIQGDEPLINPKMIDEVASSFNDPDTEIATLAKLISNENELLNPNIPKVILNKKGQAIYFSRHPIPFSRNTESESWLNHHKYLKHIGIYGYRRETLEKIVKLKQTPLELSESLEQLRWLENGFSIHVGITNLENKSVDTPEDLEYVRKLAGNS